jgi:hypothetical protein
VQEKEISATSKKIESPTKKPSALSYIRKTKVVEAEESLPAKQHQKLSSNVTSSQNLMTKELDEAKKKRITKEEEAQSISSSPNLKKQKVALDDEESLPVSHQFFSVD